MRSSLDDVQASLSYAFFTLLKNKLREGFLLHIRLDATKERARQGLLYCADKDIRSLHYLKFAALKPCMNRLESRGYKLVMEYARDKIRIDIATSMETERDSFAGLTRNI